MKLTDEERIYLSELYEKYARMLFVCSYSITRQAPDPVALAQECMQETFEKAMLKIHVLQSHPNPAGWLRSTCTKITAAKMRKARNRSRILGKAVTVGMDDQLPDPHDCIAEWLLKYDQELAKQSLLSTLTEQELSVYRTYYEEEMTIRETADKLNTSETSVRSALQRIKKKLAKTLSNFL